MSAENGVPAELLIETCNLCGGTGLVTDPQILGRFELGKPVGIKQRRCVVCNGTGQIRLNERMFDGSRTSHGMQKQIDDLRFKDELNSNGIQVLQNRIAELEAENKFISDSETALAIKCVDKQSRIEQLEAENKRLRELIPQSFDKGWITWGDAEALKDFLHANGLGEG